MRLRWLLLLATVIASSAALVDTSFVGAPSASPAGTGSIARPFTELPSPRADRVASVLPTLASAGATAKLRFSLTLNVVGPGTVAASPGATCAGYLTSVHSCKLLYAGGTKVKLTALPKVGAKLLSWSGSISGTALTQTVTMTAEKIVVATFVKLPPSSPPSGGGKGVSARYTILAARLQMHTEASQTTGTGICDEVGGFEGSIDFAAALPAPLSRPTAHLEQGFGGRLSGDFHVKVPAKWTNHHLRGCKVTDDGVVRCVAQAPDQTPTPGGLWPIGFSIAPTSKGSSVKLLWSVSDPEVGFATGGGTDPFVYCLVHIAGALETDEVTQTVPLTRFTQDRPVTLTFSRRLHLDRTINGQPASIDHSWSYTLTFRRSR